MPAPGWQPKGWIVNEGRGGPTTHNVHVHSVHRTPQFWLLFTVLCFNVTAGIGVIGVAKTMVRDIFAGVPSTLAPGTSDFVKTFLQKYRTFAEQSETFTVRQSEPLYLLNPDLWNDVESLNGIFSDEEFDAVSQKRNPFI